jgi:hypothetical protein
VPLAKIDCWTRVLAVKEITVPPFAMNRAASCLAGMLALLLAPLSARAGLPSFRQAGNIPVMSNANVRLE